MIRRLVFTYLVITAFGLALLAVPLGTTFAHREKDRLLFDIERDAQSMSSLVEDPLEKGTPVPSGDIVAYAKRTGGHVVVVNDKGIALLDTDHLRQKPRDYSNRPEINVALNGDRAQGTRHSDTAGTTLVYSAVPTTANGRVNGAVRITYPTATLDARIRQAWGRLALLCLGVLAAVAIVGFVIARSITRPLRRLEQAADKFAAGELDAHVEIDRGPPEIRRLAATFNRMAERLSTLLDAQQRFVADASHQLRTPLTALRLRLENLDAHVSPQDRPAIAAANAEVTRMNRLVEGLLVLARDEAESKASIAIDAAEIAAERVGVWREITADRDVTLSIDAPRSAPAMALPGALEQLIDNLLDNALTVAPARSTITVRVETHPHAVGVHVLDEGPGLDASARARAFDRFWRAPDAPVGGSGLGLAIVRQLADASGGSVRLDAREPRGLDAVVLLPVPANAPQAAIAAALPS
jgi:signal transduction histidine kinase